MTNYIEGPRRKKILYVEDDKTYQKMVQIYFENKGFKVDVTPDVIQALMRLIYIKYDAIILDFHLPMISPEESEHALRKARVPICYFTQDVQAAKEISTVPVVCKISGGRSGLKELEETVEMLMRQPVPDDYSITQKIPIERPPENNTPRVAVG